MKTITIITPANIEVEYRLAGAASRLAAFIIDFLLQMLMIAITSLIVVGINYVISGGEEISTVSLSIIISLSFIIHFGYFIVCELTMNGQTFGKRIFGLRAIRENGQPLEFSQSLVRGLVRSAVDIIYVGLVIILFNPLHKRLGDIVAGTIVVCEKYKNSSEPGLYAPEWPHFLPNPLDVTEQERQMVDEWLRRRDTLSDQGVAIGQKLAKYFNDKKTREDAENESKNDSEQDLYS